MRPPDPPAKHGVAPARQATTWLLRGLLFATMVAPTAALPLRLQGLLGLPLEQLLQLKFSAAAPSAAQ